MSNKRILEKIEKLMAMSKSSSAYEAAIALERISKLMQEHNISKDDINLSSIDTVTFYLPTFLRYKNTMILVASTITKAFGVKAIISYWNTKQSKIQFYGNKDRIALIDYTLKQLIRQISIEKEKETIAYQLKMKEQISDLFSQIFIDRDDLQSIIRSVKEQIDLYDPHSYTIFMYKNLAPYFKGKYGLLMDLHRITQDSEYKKLTNRHIKSFIIGWLETARSKIVEFAISQAEKDLLIEYSDKVLSKNNYLADIKIQSSKMTYDQYESYLAGKENAQKSFKIKNAINGKDSGNKLSYKD